MNIGRLAQGHTALLDPPPKQIPQSTQAIHVHGRPLQFALEHLQHPSLGLRLASLRGDVAPQRQQSLRLLVGAGDRRHRDVPP